MCVVYLYLVISNFAGGLSQNSGVARNCSMKDVGLSGGGRPLFGLVISGCMALVGSGRSREQIG